MDQARERFWAIRLPTCWLPSDAQSAKSERPRKPKWVKNAGIVAIGLGDALRIARQIDDRLAQFFALAALAAIFASAGESRLVARLLGAAEAVCTGAGASVSVMLAPMLAATQEQASAILGSATFGAEFESGKELSREAAIALALNE